MISLRYQNQRSHHLLDFFWTVGSCSRWSFFLWRVLRFIYACSWTHQAHKRNGESLPALISACFMTRLQTRRALCVHVDGHICVIVCFCVCARTTTLVGKETLMSPVCQVHVHSFFRVVGCQMSYDIKSTKLKHLNCRRSTTWTCQHWTWYRIPKHPPPTPTAPRGQTYALSRTGKHK